MKQNRKIFAVFLAVAVFLTSICPTNNSMAAVKRVKRGNGWYTITSEKKKEVRFDKTAKKSTKSITIPATVKIGKKKYKVVEIKANALVKSKVQKLVIGKNVRRIGKKAFYKSKLKSVTIKTKNLKAVGKNAFGKINKKAVVKLPALSKSKTEAYKKLLKNGGLKGKKQVVKTNETNTSSAPKKPRTIPNPETRFVIGEMEPGVADCWKNTSTDATYNSGESMNFTLSFELPWDAYGNWHTEEKSVHKYVKCTCGKYFETNSNDQAAHVSETGHGHDWIVTVPGTARVPLWYWTPDDTPCKVRYHAILPEGVTINKESIEVWKDCISQISSNEGNYSIQVSGQEMDVIINDIKPTPYRRSNTSPAFPIIVKFSAKLEETAANVNQVNANIVYNCGGGDKNIALKPVIVRKK